MLFPVRYYNEARGGKLAQSLRPPSLKTEISMDILQKQLTRFFTVPLLTISLVLSGCIRYRPQPEDRASFMERVQTQSDGGVTATLSVLSDKEAKRIFGVNLAKRGVQPVWIDIENQSRSPYVFIPRNMDPNYYSSEEAAYMAHLRQARSFLEAGLIGVIFFPALALIPVNFFAVRHVNKKMDGIFQKNALPSNIIMPGSKESGFVFTSVDEGTKHVTVDLLSPAGSKTFNYVFKVPGIKPDYTTKDYEARYPEEQIIQCDKKDTPELLSKLPCCTTNKKGTRNGDPFNLVVLGELEDIVTIFTSAGWDETEALSFKSGFLMMKDFFTGATNRYSPISPLYYKGHPQDIAFQKARENINQRLHLRLWYTPLRYEGKPVWIGAISRDIGVKFTFRTWYLTTHKIDPNVDDARDYLLADLLQVEKISNFSFLQNIAAEKFKGPKKNLTGDHYFTDNKILVVTLSEEDTVPNNFAWDSFLPDSSSAQ